MWSQFLSNNKYHSVGVQLARWLAEAYTEPRNAQCYCHHIRSLTCDKLAIGPSALYKNTQLTDSCFVLRTSPPWEIGFNDSVGLGPP